MRNLHQIELFLDGTYLATEAKAFLVNSRCICNYIERALAELNFKSPYSRLNIFCTRYSHPASVTPYKNERYLEVRIPLEVIPISHLSLPEIHQQYSRVIAFGIEAASAFTPIPTKEISEALENFERGGYLNQWEYLNKSWSRLKCRAIISVEVTVDYFSADQLVFINDALIAKRRIAQSSPREGIFSAFLGHLSINRQGIIQYKKKSKVLSAFDLQRQAFIDPTPNLPHS